MTVKDQLKILDNKIRQNKADYDLYRKNAKISALSSGKLDKYEYLTGEDLGYRPDPVQKAKFEKQEGFLKRLKNIEDKTDNQLDLVENQKIKQSEPIGKINFSDEKINNLAEDVIKKTKKYEDENLENNVGKGDKFNVNPYKNLERLVKKITNGEISIKKAKEQQDELWNEIYKMKKRTSGQKISKKFSIKNKKIILNLIKVGNQLYNIRDKITHVFEKKEIVEPNFEWIRDVEAFNEVLNMVEENTGLEAITNFKIVNLKRVSRFIDEILSGKINNKYDAEKIYREIMKDEDLLRDYKNFSRNKYAQIIATIISHLGYALFGPLLSSKDNADDIENVDIRDMPDLESEENAEKRQKAHGLKIMTPSQLITILPILLAQKQAGNNSQKQNNEIRQIIYSLYRSKNLSKTVYNHLINNI